jgi:hypothetical protein
MCGVLDKVFLEFSFDDIAVQPSASNEHDQWLLENNQQDGAGVRWDPLVDVLIDDLSGGSVLETWQQEPWHVPDFNLLPKIGAAL